jgi:hypothetical protein
MNHHRKPFIKVLATYRPGGHIKYDLFLLIYAGNDFMAVQHKKRFHRSMADALIAVEKG